MCENKEYPIWLNYLNDNARNQQPGPVQKSQPCQKQRQAIAAKERLTDKLKQREEAWAHQREELKADLRRLSAQRADKQDKQDKQNNHQIQLKNQQLAEVRAKLLTAEGQRARLELELKAEKQTFDQTQTNYKQTQNSFNQELARYKKLVTAFPEEAQRNKKQISALNQALARSKVDSSACDPAGYIMLKSKAEAWTAEKDALNGELQTYKKLLRDFPDQQDRTRRRLEDLSQEVNRYKTLLAQSHPDKELEKLAAALRLEKQEREAMLKAKQDQLEQRTRKTDATWSAKYQALKVQKQAQAQKRNAAMKQAQTKIQASATQAAKRAAELQQVRNALDAKNAQLVELNAMKGKSAQLQQLRAQVKKDKALLEAYDPAEAAKNAAELRRLKAAANQKKDGIISSIL